MRDRSVIALQTLRGGQQQILVTESSIHLADASQPSDIRLPDLQPPGNSHGVLEYGREIYNGIAQAHGAIRRLLGMLKSLQPTSRHALYFVVNEANEKYYWETLCDSGDNFLALEKRWPIARIPQSSLIIDHKPRDFTGTLRILAVMSAFDPPIQAREQYEALLTAVKDARDRGIDAKLHVRVGEPPLLALIEEMISHSGSDFVECGPIPNGTTEFQNLCDDFQPHILHFFCHGIAKAGARVLLLAKNADWVAGDSVVEPLQLVPEDFRDLSGKARKSLWLAVFNCCQAGQATSKESSFIHQLVNERTVPNAIGMQEDLTKDDAKTLAEHLYSRILRTVAELKQGMDAGDTCTLEWVDSLYDCRKSINRRNGDDPNANHAWAIPVLYVQKPEFGFKFVIKKLGDQAMIRIETVAKMLADLDISATMEMRRDLLNILDEDPAIPKQFWPNEFGDFDSGATQ